MTLDFRDLSKKRKQSNNADSRDCISYHWLQLGTIDALGRWAQKHLNADKLNCNKLFEIFNKKVYAVHCCVIKSRQDCFLSYILCYLNSFTFPVVAEKSIFTCSQLKSKQTECQRNAILDSVLKGKYSQRILKGNINLFCGQ